MPRPRPPLALLVLGACSAAPAPPPPPPSSTAPIAAPPAPLPPGRWIHVGGATLLGPRLPAGQVALVGGQRVLVAPDGTAKAQREGPHGLEALALVPVAGGGAVLVGHGAEGLHRFDDPLGPGTRIARGSLTSFGTAPGLVIARAVGGLGPALFEITPGAAKAPTFGALPPIQARFLDAQRGAAIFPALGLATTVDGGATWRASRAGDGALAWARAADTLDVAGDAVVASRAGKDQARAIDLTTGAFAAAAPAVAPATSPLARWIERAGTPPLVAAVEHGVDAGDGTAIVGREGLVARVELATGLVTAVEELGGLAEACEGTRRGSDVWLVCSVNGLSAYRIPASAKGLGLGKPVKTWSDGQVVTSSAGGLAVLAPCEQRPGRAGAERGAVGACILGEDGAWIDLGGDLGAWAGGTDVVPTRDGRLVRFASDDLTQRESPGFYVSGPGGFRPSVSPGFAPGGAAPASPGFAPGGASPLGAAAKRILDHTTAIDVDERGAFTALSVGLAKLQRTKRGPTAVLTLAADGKAKVVDLGDVEAVAYGGAHVVALRPTTDGAPTQLVLVRHGELEGERSGPPAGLDGELRAGPLGFRYGDWLHVGWGAARQPPPAAEPEVEADDGPPRATLRLACTKQGPASKLPSLAPGSPAQRFFARPAAAGSERAVLTSGNNPFRAVALEGPANAAPRTWSFHWLDPLEVGGRPRSATLPAPPAPRSVFLREAVTRGDHAVFVLEVGAERWLARVDGAKVELATKRTLEAVGWNAEAALGSLVVGEASGDPIAWRSQTGAAAVAWPAGDAPSVAAFVSPGGYQLLGAPTRAALPLFAEVGGVRAWTSVALSKKPKPELPSHAAFARLPALDGLRACTTKDKGALARLMIRVEVTLDGEKRSGRAWLELRAKGTDACLVRLFASNQPSLVGHLDHAGVFQLWMPTDTPWLARADLVAGKAEVASGALEGMTGNAARCSLVKP